MPYTFPTLASGACYVKSDILGQPLAKYPLRQTTGYVTRVVRFLNDEEQSWTVRTKLASFELQYRAANGYDVGKIQSFFDTFNGRYTDPAYLFVFSIAIDGVTYNYCVFDQDEFEVSESPEKPGYYNFTIKIKQVRPN